MPLGTESVICPDFETTAARGGRPSVKGLEEESNLPAIRGARDHQFSGEISGLRRTSVANLMTMQAMAEVDPMP